MASKSTRKGDSEERAIVNMLREKGYSIERTLQGGARSDGSKTYDLDFYAYGQDETPLIGECKLRASGFKQIYKWLDDNDFLTIRADRQERLWVLPERVILDIISKLQ